MKRSFFYLPLFLLFVFIVLSSLDHSDYALEKKIWLLQKQYDQVSLNPRSISENQFDSLVSQCNELIAQNPNSKLLSNVYMKLAEIYSLKKDYRSARQYYSVILDQYSDQQELSANALMKFGQTYEVEGDTNKAIDAYRQISQRYPRTKTALKVPLYIVNYYLRIKHYDDAIPALKEAEGLYQQLVVNSNDPYINFYARAFLARTYMAEERWKDSIIVLKNILIDYGQSPYLDWNIAHLIIEGIDQLSVEKLHDPQEAISIYRLFLEKYPNHPLKAVMNGTIGTLEGLKGNKMK